ncbi:hypothetical protein FJQ98_21150 [Lysinibacillus agricola]|uniref:Crp/Fnr family transcriptional regulator n=1 Tax=Lysinibacillus agricola TaxID=2590012 RepID=A0ABX7AQ08_9BACI|nr:MULTISPECIES: hypothetical protein [Lysinibacillus]KOS64859.1 hypothetical protein AN161_00810 [Lysinibacillus sp. FJAT-14222]QQP11666.1 hypothetical protein FJQ98_21150 [Lysinibacillus agricola]
MTALSVGKQLVQLNPTTRRKAIAQKQNYVVKDGKPYSLETGEYLGDLFTHDLVPKMTESKFRAIESIQALGSHEEENGGFVFAFFQQSRTIIERFPSLNNADIARLMYLGTYIAWNTGRLQYDNGKVINREGFEKLTGLSSKRARELFSRYCQEGIISESEGALYMNPRALKKSIASHIARYSTIKSLNASLFSFGTVTLLLFSEAFHSLSAGERRAHSCQLKKNVYSF